LAKIAADLFKVQDTIFLAYAHQRSGAFNTLYRYENPSRRQLQFKVNRWTPAPSERELLARTRAANLATAPIPEKSNSFKSRIRKSYERQKL